MPSLLVLVKHDLIVGGGWGPSASHRRAQGGEMLPTLPVALALRSKEAGCFCEVAGMSIVDAGGSRSQ